MKGWRKYLFQLLNFVRKYKLPLSLFLSLSILSLLFTFKFQSSDTLQELKESKKILVSQSSNPRHQVPSQNQLPTKIKKSVFRRFQLSESEIEAFYERRFEPRKTTLEISGLKIDKKIFKVDAAKDLPKNLTIPLPEGGTNEFTQDFVDFKNKDNFVWVGKSTDPLKTLFLSFYNLSFVGEIETQEARYEIKQLSKDKNIIRKIDRDYFLSTSDDSIPVQTTDRIVKNIFKRETRFSKATSSITINIIVGYSHLIKQSEGGVDPAIALLNLHVSGAQTAHRNSRTGVTLNVTEMIELNVQSTPGHLRGNLNKLLEAQQNIDNYQATNPYHILMRRRHQTRSDLATLITEQSTGANCGVAYLLNKYVHSSETFKDYGLSVVGGNCSMGTLPHEIGHNLGCQHSRDQLTHDAAQLTNPYAFGFKGSSFRTVMVSGCGSGRCSRVLYYSNPLQTLNNVMIGEEGKVDNVRSIRERSHIIANIYPDTNNSSLQITQQPQGGSVKEGGTLTLSVSTSSSSNLKYQWYRGQTQLIGETQSTLTLDSASYTGNLATYHVEIQQGTNQVTSHSVSVSFLRRPRLLNDLTDLSVDLNASVQLSFQATGHPTPTITWYKDGRVIPHQKDQTLWLRKVQWPHRGTYLATLVNSEGSVQTRSVRLGIREENKWNLLFRSDNPNVDLIELGKIDRNVGIKSNREQP